MYIRTLFMDIYDTWFDLHMRLSLEANGEIVYLPQDIYVLCIIVRIYIRKNLYIDMFL